MPLTHLNKRKAEALLRFIQTGEWFADKDSNEYFSKILVGIRPTQADLEAVQRESIRAEHFASTANSIYCAPSNHPDLTLKN